MNNPEIINVESVPTSGSSRPELRVVQELITEVPSAAEQATDGYDSSSEIITSVPGVEYSQEREAAIPARGKVRLGAEAVKSLVGFDKIASDSNLDQGLIPEDQSAAEYLASRKKELSQDQES